MNWYCSPPVLAKDGWECHLFYGQDPEDYYDKVWRVHLGDDVTTEAEARTAIEAELREVNTLNNLDAPIIWLEDEDVSGELPGL